MKTLYYFIIAILIFSTLLYLKPIQADATNGIEIKNIQTLPSTIIIGQTFKISTTLVNNSSKSIFVDYGSCEAPFSVTFDTHVLVNETHPICNLSLLEQKLNSGENTTATSPSLDLVYKAMQNGTVNATVTFPYQIWNQTSQSNSNTIVSEPFSFTIYGKTHVPTLSPSDNQAIIDAVLAIPGLQKWSNDWQFVSMGFMTAKNQPGNWQYATVNLKASSSSSLISCDNNNEDWSAWVMIDRTTMKVIQATYPTIESHNCNYTTGGGPASYGGTIPNIDTPLKQFKSGVAANDVKCAQGLELVIRAENNSPACVKYSSVQKLVDWGLILTRLSVDGLKETYSMGEKINATISFQGIMHYCDYPQIQVLDSNQNVVLKSKERDSMCVSNPFIPLPYVAEKLDLDSAYGGLIMINDTGSYTLKISLSGNDIEKGFTVGMK